MEPNKESILRAIQKFNRAVDGNMMSTSNAVSLKAKLEMLANDSSAKASEKAVRPWNYADFQTRLFSFKNTSHWFAKPMHLSPWQCARFGWYNSGVDTISCASCGSSIVCLSTYFNDFDSLYLMLFITYNNARH